MRAESVSGAYFIHCQCACSQLMLQSRVTSLEKTCDDSESCDSPKRKQQNVDMTNSEWPSCKDLIRFQMVQFSQGLGNKHNLNYSCVIWIMTLKMRSLRVYGDVPADATPAADCRVAFPAPCSPCWQKHRALGTDSAERKRIKKKRNRTPTLSADTQFTDGQRLMALCLERQIIQITKTT